MRIVVACDKFKGCLSAPDVARAMEAGLHSADPSAEVDLCPLADGGEGTVEALVTATGGKFVTCRVTGPLPEMKVEARFGILGDRKTAVIAMSAASGLALLRPENFDPMRATTFGTGELMMAAAALGVERIILGLGGSATIDGGLGCAQACGLPVILEDGEPVSWGEPLTAADLPKVVLIKHGRGSAIERISVIGACDVDNPLLGPRGAAAVFGPQKGALAEQVKTLDASLAQLATRTGKQAFTEIPGAGAAGGLGFGLAAFFGAKLRSGIDMLIEATELRERLAHADWCLTGEGRFDSQSMAGKVVCGVARACRDSKVPCIVLAGSVETGLELGDTGVSACFSICDGPMSGEEAIARAESLIAAAAGNILRCRGKENAE